VEEKAYRLLVDETLRKIDDAFADVDPDLVESNISQGALTLSFPNGLRAVVSPQPPVRQMWLAFRDRAWHFDWDGARWLDDKGEGKELGALIVELVQATSGARVTI
jgi:CyaY protein